MSEKLPLIVNGNFSFGYYETSNKKEVEQYYEVDLGELNLVAQHSKTKGEKDAGTYTDLEKKTYNYHRDENLLQKTIPLLIELNIGSYTSDDSVVNDFDKLFPKLLKAGYFLRGTKTACLLKSVKPSNDQTDFEYFFATKLYLVSKKLSRIDKFLDFQLEKSIEEGNSAIDFNRFVRLIMRQFTSEISFSKEVNETVVEWLEGMKTNIKAKPKKDSLKQPGWNKSLAILVHIFRSVTQNTFIISNQEETCDAFEIISGYSSKSLQNFIPKIKSSPDNPNIVVKSDFIKVEKFLKNAIRELDNLTNSR